MTPNSWTLKLSSAGLLCLASCICFALPAASGEPPELTLIATRLLPSKLSQSTDVRWLGERSVYIAAGRQGSVELSLDGEGSQLRQVFPLNELDWRESSAALVAVSSKLLSFAPPLFDVVWRERPEGSIRRASAHHILDVILDLDAFGDRLLIVGGRRGDDGSYLPEGAFAWLAETAEGKLDLQPVYYSGGGADAPSFKLCGPMQVSAGRFLTDGSFVIVPGVDPDIFLYSPAGELKRTWDTEALGIDTDCPLSRETKRTLSRDWKLRHEWLSQRRVVDGILPLPQGPAAIVRSVVSGTVSWELKLLTADGGSRRFRVPFTASSIYSRLRGDVRDGEIVLLRSDLRADEEQEGEIKLYVLRAPEG